MMTEPICGEPNPLRRVNPDWDATCTLPLGHIGLHQTSMDDGEGTEVVSWVWDESMSLLGPGPLAPPDPERWAKGQAVRAALDVVRWERCSGCGHEYRYPYLCREHLLCGPCHPPVGDQ